MVLKNNLHQLYEGHQSKLQRNICIIEITTLEFILVYMVIYKKKSQLTALFEPL